MNHRTLYILLIIAMLGSGYVVMDRYYLTKNDNDTAASQNNIALPRTMFEAPKIELTKVNEYFDSEHLVAAQGIRAYTSPIKNDEGLLAVSSGYLNGTDLYDLDFNSIFRKSMNDDLEKKTLFADVVRLQDGRYAYTDFKQHRIVVLNADGSENAIWRKDLNLENPIGIDQFSDGTILIVDYGNNVIKTVSTDGKLIRIVSHVGKINLIRPYDARILNDTVYLVDRMNHRIFILNRELRLMDVIEKAPDGSHYFNHPQHIDFDSQGRLYVMDTKSKSVKVIDTKNHQVIAQLIHPDIHIMRGIAIDAEDRIYLAGFKTGFPDLDIESLQEIHAGIIVFAPIQFDNESQTSN